MILTLLVNLFYRLPSPLRRTIRAGAAPQLQFLKGILALIRDQRLPVYRFETGRLSCVFIGHRSVMPYLARQLGGQPDRAVFVKNIYAWQIDREMKAMSESADLVFAQIAHKLARAARFDHCLRVPLFVDQFARLPPTVDGLKDAIRNPLNKDDLRKVHKLEFEYRVSRDDRDMVAFYEACHRPYITQRHGKTCYVNPLKDFRRFFQDGELLLVHHDGEVVSGALNQKQGDTYNNLYNGLRDADDRLLKQGAISAVYYYLHVEAIRRKCRTLALGHSRPFLNDGVLRYKRKWNSRIQHDAEQTRLMLMCVPELRPPASEFIEVNPMIHERDGALMGAVFLGNHVPCEEAQWRQVPLYAYPGLALLHVFLLNDAWQAQAATLARLAERARLPLRLVDFREAASLGPEAFARRLAGELKQCQPNTAEWLAPAEPVPAPAEISCSAARRIGITR